MATLQDVLNAVDALNAADANVAATQAVRDTAALNADNSIPTETAAFQAALATYNTALNAARATYGFPAADAAYNAAVEDAATKKYELRDIMIEYANGIT